MQKGAMPSQPRTRIIVPMPKDLIALIDDFRWQNRIPSRAAAIRQFIRLGLKHKEQQKT
jgi:metal-responsive CopG/Arc/MetJ family transcriptional regulator